MDEAADKTTKPPKSQPEEGNDKEKDEDKRKTSRRREDGDQHSFQQRQHQNADNTSGARSGGCHPYKSTERNKDERYVSGRSNSREDHQYRQRHSECVDAPHSSIRQDQKHISTRITALDKLKSDKTFPLGEPFLIDKSATIGGTISSGIHKSTTDKKLFKMEKHPKQVDEKLEHHSDVSAECDGGIVKANDSPTDFELAEDKMHKRRLSKNFVEDKSPSSQLEFKQSATKGLKRRHSAVCDTESPEKKLKLSERRSSGLPAEEDSLLAEEQKKNKHVTEIAAASEHSVMLLSPPPDLNVVLVSKSPRENQQNGKQISTVEEVPTENNNLLSPPLELNVSEKYESDVDLGNNDAEDDIGDKTSVPSINSNDEQVMEDSELSHSPDEDVYLVGYFDSGMPNVRYSAHDPLHDKLPCPIADQDELPITSPKLTLTDIPMEVCKTTLPPYIQNQRSPMLDTLLVECEKPLTLAENSQKEASVDSLSSHSNAVEISPKTETTDNVITEPEVEAGGNSTKLEVTQASDVTLLLEVERKPTETSEFEVQNVSANDDFIGTDQVNATRTDAKETDSETLSLADVNGKCNNEPAKGQQQSAPNLTTVDEQPVEEPALKCETNGKPLPINEISHTQTTIQPKDEDRERQETKLETPLPTSPEPSILEPEFTTATVEATRYQTPDEHSSEADSDSNSQLEPENVAAAASDTVEDTAGSKPSAALSPVATMPPPIHIVGDLDEESEEEAGADNFAKHESDGVPAVLAAVESTFAAPTPTNTPLTKSVMAKRRPSTSTLQAVKLSAKDEFFKKPFEYGWKRELVWRSNLDSTCKADVYFISPIGKKFRSRSDIVPLLEGDLTIEHFCFIREPQDVGPQFELVRNAKSANRNVSASQSAMSGNAGASMGLAAGSTPLVMGKRISKPKAPKGASPPPQGWTAVRALRSNNAALGYKNFGVNSSGTPSTGARNRHKSTSLKSTDQQEVKLTQTNSSIGNSKDIAQTGSLRVAKTSQKRDDSNNVQSRVSLSNVMSSTISKHPTTPHTLAIPTPLTATSTSAATKLPKSEFTQEIVVIKGKKFISMAQPVVHTPRIEINKSIATDIKRLQTNIQNTVAQVTSVPNTTVSNVPQPAISASTNFFANLSMGYNSIVSVIRLLKLQDRARLASVCRLWHAATNDRRLWQSVRLRNTRVTDWNIFTRALCSHETRHLDMRKMLQLSSGSSSNQHRNDEMWHAFMRHIGKVYTLETLELPRCAALVVENVLRSNAENLRILNASTINDEQLCLAALADMKQLQELRLRAIEPCQLMDDLSGLAQLTQLTQLSLVGICNLSEKSIGVLSSLEHLLTLELGDCGRLNSQQLAAVLPDMKQLRRLRLETGIARESPSETAEFCVLALLKGVRLATQLSQLELINFDVKPGFDTHLAQCTQLRKLLFIPTYILQSATTNQIIMRAVQNLPDSLTAFTWGFTIELLRVTALYSDSNAESKDESIPVLRPVPGDVNDRIGRDSAVGALSTDDQHVAIISLKQVEYIMRETLPNMKFSTAKMFYATTWKQQIIN